MIMSCVWHLKIVIWVSNETNVYDTEQLYVKCQVSNAYVGACDMLTNFCFMLKSQCLFSLASAATPVPVISRSQLKYFLF